MIPSTTLLGVKPPKPVGGYTETILRVIGVVFGALGQGRSEPRDGRPVRHDQCSVAGRSSRRTARAG